MKVFSKKLTCIFLVGDFHFTNFTREFSPKTKKKKYKVIHIPVLEKKENTRKEPCDFLKRMGLESALVCA